MLRGESKPQGSPKSFCDRCIKKSLHLHAVLLSAGLMFGIVLPQAHAGEPFKVANIHFETNASACDMGIQIGFDTDGITEGFVNDPHGSRLYVFESRGTMKATGGQTEGFL